MGRCPLGVGFRPLQALKFRIEQAERTPWGNCSMTVSWVDDCAPVGSLANVSIRKSEIAAKTNIPRIGVEFKMGVYAYG
jgi:hypothetical protein